MDTLRIRDTTWSYPQPPNFTVRINSLDIPQNTSIYLAGPSGCGKSTLLSLLAGTIQSPFCKIRCTLFPSISYIMHQSTLAPWLCLAQNIRLEGKLRRIDADIGLLVELLDSFGLRWTDLAKTFPRQLSLGMRQRFEIAKSLAFRPSLILLDEGFSGIDTATRDIVISKLSAKLYEFRCTTIFTSHNLIDGLRLADFVVQVHDGEVSEAKKMGSDRSERTHLPVEVLLKSAEAAALI